MYLLHSSDHIPITYICTDAYLAQTNNHHQTVRGYSFIDQCLRILNIQPVVLITVFAAAS
jgi:hypothetical protein